MFVDRKEVENAYNMAEQARLKLWQLLETASLEPCDNHEPLQDVLIKTEQIENYIKITVGDVLPRDTGLSKTSLQMHWYGIMHRALSQVDRKFDKVFCIIKVFNPAPYWDVDNRAYKIILDSLRYNQLIKDDNCNYMSFMIDGEVDRVNPRTEVYLFERSQVTLLSQKTN